MIVRSGSRWVVKAKSGKVLGVHKSKSAAQRQLRAVEANRRK